MLNFCVFVFVFYALFAIVRMLMEYTKGTPSKASRAKRRRISYEENGFGFGVSETQGVDKAYF